MSIKSPKLCNDYLGTLLFYILNIDDSKPIKRFLYNKVAEYFKEMNESQLSAADLQKHFGSQKQVIDILKKEYPSEQNKAALDAAAKTLMQLMEAQAPPKQSSQRTTPVR